MSWKLYYANPDGSNEQNVNLEALGALEGGQVTGDDVQFKFSSHKASELTLRIPGLNPVAVPKIPFTGRVRLLDNNGVQQFVGRRVDWDAQVSAEKQGFSYQFLDAWWDLSKMTFKTTWQAGGYQPVTFAAGVFTLTSQYFSTSSIGYAATACFYDASFHQLGNGFIVSRVSGSYTNFTVLGGTGTYAGAKYVAFQTQNTDVVLFQYAPTDPYQNASQVVQFYITTGEQIKEILRFAISLGVQLQIGEIDPSLYVPWYPVRCQNLAECIKVCLRDHPDCFTEIDYTTTPPTFNVRMRTSLTPKTLPYAYTDVNGIQHTATDIKPRPDLIPSRIGIFYRVVINGTIVSQPEDIWPVNQPDGLLAMDYSIDLQGPRMQASFGEIDSVAFNPADTSWWQTKCAALKTPDISGLLMVNADGTPYTGANLTVLDNNGMAIDYINTYQWEMTGGSKALWMSGINAVEANVTTYFQYQKKNAAGVLDGDIKAHPQTVRVQLVNTASIQQSFYQFLTTGEAIPPNLAESIYASLQPMQYNLRQSQREEPFTSFIKPGKHCINLNGGNVAWQTINATVQETTYTLRQRPDGTVWAMSDISCGPVEHLEAGQLVQLFNIFASRDLSKIDPWERITGQTSGGSSSISTTSKENTEPGIPSPLVFTSVNTIVDVSGNFTTVQTNVKTSGLYIFKWDGTTVDGTGLRQPKSSTPGFLLDLTDVQNLINAAGTITPVAGFSADDCYKLKAREVKLCDDSGNIFYAIVLIGGGYTKS